MPYEIKRFGKGYRVYMPDNPDFFFSYKPMSKSEAVRQKYALEMSGEGLFSYLKNIFNPNVSPNFEKAIDSFGDYYINELRIVREPIQSILKKTLNLFSLGKFNKYKEKYDDIFHLSLLLDLVNPKDNYSYYKKTEKRPNIHFEGISKNNYMKNYKETYNINPINKKIKLKDVLMLTKKNMGSFLYTYDPVINNCQTYIYNIIKAYYEILKVPLPDEIKIFILQDVEDIVTGTARNVATKVTNLGHLFGRIMGNGSDNDAWESFKSGFMIGAPLGSKIFTNPSEGIKEVGLTLANIFTGNDSQKQKYKEFVENMNNEILKTQEDMRKSTKEARDYVDNIIKQIKLIDPKEGYSVQLLDKDLKPIIDAETQNKIKDLNDEREKVINEINSYINQPVKFEDNDVGKFEFKGGVFNPYFYFNDKGPYIGVNDYDWNYGTDILGNTLDPKKRIQEIKKDVSNEKQYYAKLERDTLKNVNDVFLEYQQIIKNEIQKMKNEGATQKDIYKLVYQPIMIGRNKFPYGVSSLERKYIAAGSKFEIDWPNFNWGNLLI